MSNWTEKTCACGNSFAVHDDWSNPPDVCSDCMKSRKETRRKPQGKTWLSKTCENCGRNPVYYLEEWDKTPRFCKDCKESYQAQWIKSHCKGCGTEIVSHRDWSHPRHYCKACKAANDKKWYKVPCHHCGRLITAHRDWSEPPRYHKECAWYEKPCKHCGGTMRIHRDWQKIPEYHKECAWYEVPCEICGKDIHVYRSWEKPPKYHKDCKQRFLPKTRSCTDCGKSFTLSTGLQVKCDKNGWQLPKRCSQCKEDALLVKGAVGALSEQQRRGLTVEVEQKGILFPRKKITLKDRKTGKKVGKVEMRDEGLFFNKRTAVVNNPQGKEVSKTREGEKGFFFPKRVADTRDKKTGKHTHRTEVNEKGIICPRKVIETFSVADKNAPKVKITSFLKGFFFKRRILKTGKKK